MEQDFGKDTGVPRVQGFIFTEGPPIPNLKFFNPGNKPGGTKWQQMLTRIRETGDKTSETTGRGENHPCQTEDLRCDHQGGVSGTDLINTQVQLGGVKTYPRGKYGGGNESTSVTVVHIDSACYFQPMVKEALAQAHDYSLKTNKVVVLKLANTTSTSIANNNNSSPARTRSFTCQTCRKNFAAASAIDLGVKLGSYPPSCGKDKCQIVRDW